MATPIRIKRSAVPSKKPKNDDLLFAELGLNTFDGRLFLKQDQGKLGISTRVIEVGAGSRIGKTIFVTATGNDGNSGLNEIDSKASIKAAAAIALPGDTIKVYPGIYIEDNPIVLAKSVSIEGTELRNCIVTPNNVDRDLFYVNNSCHVTDLSFRLDDGRVMSKNAAVVSLQPLLGVSSDRYFDATRMIRYNLDYIANETVGFLTSGFSGFAGSHREQDAARLIDLNLDYIAAESVAYLTSPSGYNFSVPSPGTTQDCFDDIKDIFKSISYDLKANSNRKSVGAALSYFNDSGALVHITGAGVSEATIATLEYAVGIAKSVINNVSPPVSYQVGIGSIPQTFDSSVILVEGGCVGVGNTISQLVGIITSSIGSGSTDSLPQIRYGVNLDVTDACKSDIKNVWKAVMHDITRGGNLKCVEAGSAYYDGNNNLLPSILKNPGEVEQTIAALDYSKQIVRAIINNSSWGSYPAGLATSIVNAEYDHKTGITTLTVPNHGLSRYDPVKIQNLVFECAENSPGDSVGVVTASYDNLTGIVVITTENPLNIQSGNRVKIENLLWQCESNGVPSTQYFPSGNYNYDFTVLDVVDSTTFKVNVGTSTLPHTYVGEGTASRIYTPSFGISTATYNHLTGISEITISGLGTDTDPLSFIKPGEKVKLENLLWECNSGSGLSQAYFPSGANGYDFTVLSTVPDRFYDAANLIESNRVEIIDKSLASIAIAHSDFYFPNDVQTTRFSRFRDAYRLIQQNRNEIIESAWNGTVQTYPPIASTEEKCKRDIGYFVDAISIDLFTGGNSYAIEFVKQYFDNGIPISNGLVGEEAQSIYAFNSASFWMKQAITNNLTVKDLTLTPDPETGLNTSPDSCANVQDAIDTLAEIVTVVISDKSLDKLNSVIVNNGIFTSGENKCRRDIGFIVDALINDLRFGTNKYIREAARAYFNANETPITNGLIGEEAESITAFNAIREYSKLAINNLLNNKDLTITSDPTTGSNIDSLSCANVQTTIDNLISILTTTISNGNLDSFPTLYVPNKIKVNVGVSTIPHTYVSGGKITTNYTSEIFPDGTFGYIFQVRNVVDENTFEFIGGRTVIDHTYVSGGTIQKYKNFQKEYTQLKDMAMQRDPSTGFNDGLNGCANVVSAIYSCIGVVTTILKDSPSIIGQKFNKTYPGNRGKGFSSVIGITSSVYNERTGNLYLEAPGVSVVKGDRVELRDALFECSSSGTISTQAFPSGKYGYEFYVDKVNADNSFVINVGASTIPHTYVSGGIIIDRSLKVTEAYYDNNTGIVTITAPGIRARVDDVITLRDLEFTCNSGAGTTTIFPTGNLGYDFRILDISGDTFSVNVGTSSISHTYLTGGIVRPPYSKGVGPITQGPYIRNCTNFIPKSIGMRVDGFEAEPADNEDIGVTGTMSVDSYTQFNQGGIGVSITNGAYSQLVSIFTICNDIAIYTASGGQCDLTNSNSSFGTYGLYSEGVGDQTSKSIYHYTGFAHTTSQIDDDVIVVSGVGTQRPYDGQALFFDKLYYFVSGITITDPGSKYRRPPRITIDAPTGPQGAQAEGSSNINTLGQVTSVDIIADGSQYETIPNVIVEPPDDPTGTTAKAEATIFPFYYSIESATKPDAGISTIVLNQRLNNTVSIGTTIYFSRVSLQITSSHSFEWVGTGNTINPAKPALGGVVITENEVFETGGGQVVYTSTDQAGNFRIGDGLVANQLTGTISGRAFDQSIINKVNPLIIALG